MIKTLNQLSLHYVKNGYLNNTQQLKSNVFEEVIQLIHITTQTVTPTPTSIKMNIDSTLILRTHTPVMNHEPQAT